MLIKLAVSSLINRRVTAVLTVISIAVSVAILLGVEHIRQQTRESFSKTVSGVDLIVGGRTSQINLLLYSVFRIGNATNNISWQTYQELTANPNVAWSVPISLGDSHRGYRVLGTTPAYFEHYKFGNKQTIEFREGRVFSGVYDAVLGAEVAAKLGYSVGQKIVIAHGLGDISFSNHDDKPFQVVGILAPTGTPIDKTVHVDLAAIEAIHIDWQGGVKIPGQTISAEQALQMDLTPKTITAFMVGLNSRIATFGYQRAVNEYRMEPLSAILPGVALSELWSMMSVVENVLRLISALVLLATLLGMTTMLLASMKEREREIAILRSLGAHASFLFMAIELEAIFLTFSGILLGVILLILGLLLGQAWMGSEFGIFIAWNPITQNALFYLMGILVLAAFLSLIPASIAYRKSLSSGLTPKS